VNGGGRRAGGRKMVEIYTDGACSGNPGPGGWAAVLLYKGQKKEITGYEADTTNNRMELTAALKALECLKEPCDVAIYSDSAYLVDAFNKNWLERWELNGWRLSGGKNEVKNADLWQSLARFAETHNIRYVRVSGHADDEMNNKCDELAVAEIKKHKS